MPLGLEASAALEDWSRQVRPLVNEAFFVRRQALRWRKNFYRVFASGLVSRAGLLGLDGVALEELSKMKSPEKENPLHERARRQRVLASCSELRLCIVTAATREGRFSARTHPTDKTRTCSSCGHVHGAIDEILFVCDGCGKLWDRDENAALNHRFSAISTQESTYTSMG
jgi:transposase